jgi:predicted nuclease of restriction endonuclease-like (RecB) superfamily
MKKLSKKTESNSSVEKTNENLLTDIRLLIEQTRSQISQAVNSALVLLNWHIGKRLREEVLREERAEYGKQIVENVAKELTTDFGKGYSRRNLFNMIRFAEVFPQIEIVQALSAQLSWSHFVEIVYLKDDLKRDFYAEMCRIERWNTRTLAAKIDGMLFERTALSKKPEKLIEDEIKLLRDEDLLTPDLVFRDPYFLDFLGLKDAYSEKDLETAILREIEKFLLELGSDFAFVARQKRITVDDDDFHIDLLFYHRKLRCLVAIELKLGKFKPADAGQVEFYLRWLNKYERQEGENAPIGLILCAEKSTQRVELLELETRGIRVAEYLTELPDKKLLERKLREAVLRAREKPTKKS